MSKCYALRGIPAMYLQNLLLTISKGALSTRFGLDINFKTSADHIEPYASTGLIMLSNTFNSSEFSVLDSPFDNCNIKTLNCKSYIFFAIGKPKYMKTHRKWMIFKIKTALA